MKCVIIDVAPFVFNLEPIFQKSLTEYASPGICCTEKSAKCEFSIEFSFQVKMCYWILGHSLIISAWMVWEKISCEFSHGWVTSKQQTNPLLRFSPGLFLFYFHLDSGAEIIRVRSLASTFFPGKICEEWEIKTFFCLMSLRRLLRRCQSICLKRLH